MDPDYALERLKVARIEVERRLMKTPLGKELDKIDRAIDAVLAVGEEQCRG